MPVRRVTIVKVGGSLLEHAESRVVVLDRVAALPGANVFVHGGGAAASEWARRFGVNQTVIDGRRITDADTLEIVTMVYGGLVNRTLVAELQARGCDALGMTGADHDLIRARRRSPEPMDYGFVGDISKVRTDILLRMLDDGVLPIVAPLTHDGHGTLLNTNADTVAAALAIALAQETTVQLLLCFDRKGVLDSNGRTLQTLDEVGMRERITAGEISGGMFPKLNAAFEALHGGVDRVVLCAAEDIATAAIDTHGEWTEIVAHA